MERPKGESIWKSDKEIKNLTTGHIKRKPNSRMVSTVCPGTYFKASESPFRPRLSAAETLPEDRREDIHREEGGKADPGNTFR